MNTQGRSFLGRMKGSRDPLPTNATPDPRDRCERIAACGANRNPTRRHRPKGSTCPKSCQAQRSWRRCRAHATETVTLPRLRPRRILLLSARRISMVGRSPNLVGPDETNAQPQPSRTHCSSDRPCPGRPAFLSDRRRKAASRRTKITRTNQGR